MSGAGGGKPDHINALLLWQCYARLDQLILAENAYNACCNSIHRVQPWNLANTLAYQGKQAALKYYRKALQLDPQPGVHSICCYAYITVKL
jgi:hypothetical protein